MESSIKHCVVSVGIGGWYAKGVDRLHKSLIYHGYTGDVITWKEQLPPGSFTHKESPYGFKVYAIKEAIRLGYKQIIWFDASAWCIKNPEYLLDVVNNQGYYFWSSGHNCAQTCNDRSLEYFGINRDQAELMHDLSSGCVALNLENEIALKFFNRWAQAETNGIFQGSRKHDRQSKDHRFLFHRQDQSCASIIANQLGMHIDDPNNLMGYYQTVMPESMIFCYRGL